MKIFLRLLVSLIGAALAVLVCELLLRAAGYLPEYWLKLKTLDSEAGKLHIVLDRDLLYRIKPKSSGGINNYGYRDYDFQKKEAGVKRLLFLGDSFIMSNNLTPEQTIPKLLEDKLGKGFEVFNMGVSGYGPDQEYLALLDQGLDLNPDLVILSVFAGNDFRDIDLNGLFTLDPEGRLVAAPSNLVKDSLPATRLQLLIRMLLQQRFLDPAVEDRLAAAFVQDKTEIMSDRQQPQSQRRLALMRGILRAFKQTLAERGIKFMVIVLPSFEAFTKMNQAQEGGGSDPYFVNEDAAAEICSSENIPVIDFAGIFRRDGGLQLYDPVYQHLNEKGAKVVAKTIFENLPAKSGL